MFPQFGEGFLYSKLVKITNFRKEYCMATILIERVLLEKALTGDREKQFELGVFYWEKHQYAKAEHWFQYAARQNHHKAKVCLRAGIRSKLFLNTREHLNNLAIEIFERLTITHPTEEQIYQLENYLYDYLERNFDINKLRYEPYDQE